MTAYQQYLRTVKNIAGILARMETVGENDMGNLPRREAARFHRATDRLRELVDDLMRGVVP